MGREALGNFWEILNRVRLCYLAYHTAGDTGCKRIWGNIPGNNAARADNTAVADSDSWADHHVGPEPAVAADMYRLCPTEMLWVALGIVELTALTGEQGMYRGYDGDVWAEVAVVTDGNLCVVLYGKVKVGKKPLAYLSVLSIMEGDGPLYEIGRAHV